MQDESTTPQAEPIPMFTGCWRDALRAMDPTITMVRTSIGSPRWAPKGLVGTLPYLEELAPKGMRHVEDPGEFRRLYRERLDSFGVDHIRSRLLEAYEGCGRRPLLLLCFEKPEDIAAGKTFCHRHTFAEWWEEQTGESVPERTAVAA